MTTPLLSEQTVQLLQNQQLAKLKQLQPLLSRKLIFSLEEKIQQETKMLLQLLGHHTNIEAELGKYSLPLDSQYFEQIFLH